jgi:hypothetical protein
MSKMFKCGSNGNRREPDWKDEVRSLVLRKKLNTHRVLQLLTSTWQSHVSL